MNKRSVGRPLKWTLDLCLEEARKYPNVATWRKESESSYNRAKAKNWFKECTGHMNIWTLDECLLVVEKFTYFEDWRSSCPDLYKFAQSKSWLPLIHQQLPSVDDRPAFSVSCTYDSFNFPPSYHSIKAINRLLKYRRFLYNLRILIDRGIIILLLNNPTMQLNFSLAVRHILNGETLQALASEYGCSRERIRQRVNKAQDKMADLCTTSSRAVTCHYSSYNSEDLLKLKQVSLFLSTGGKVGREN